jgi:integrase
MADVAALYFAKLDERIAQGKKKAKTRTGYEGSWRLHIEPTFGTTRVKDIDEDALVEFFADLTEKGLAQWSQCGIKNVLNQMFKLARREKWINRNPLEDVDPDDLPTQQRRPDYKPRLFRNEELAGMIEACPDLYRNMLVVMAVTGLRIGELCGLLWQDIDLAARTLSVARQVHFDETSREWTTVGPKGKATAVTNLSVRTIDLLGPAYDALATQQTAEIVKGYGRPTDFVFTTSDWRGASGTPVSPDNFRARGVKVAATDAGLGHVRPHDFRHTTASILAACGVTDVDAAAMMGHTVEVYHRVYAKSFEDARARRATMKALAKYGFETLVKAV